MIMIELQDPNSYLHKYHYNHLLHDYNKILVHHKDGVEGRDYFDNLIIASYNEKNLADIAHTYLHLTNNTLSKGNHIEIPLSDLASHNNYILELRVK